MAMLDSTEVRKARFDQVQHFVRRCLDSHIISCRRDLTGQEVPGDEVVGHVSDGPPSWKRSRSSWGASRSSSGVWPTSLRSLGSSKASRKVLVVLT
eukprot:5171262-Pyramimonas_sp.AAC.1